jgi:peptidyl-prolyl cis-trans isomerase A (cyclophilin A)
MKMIHVSILLCSSLLASAQTPPAAKGKEPPRGPGAKPSLLNPASLKAKAPDVFKAQFTTTKGDFVVEVHRDWSPNGADRFYNLVKNGFYDGAEFFRVVPNFMVQFGIPGNPKVAAAWGHANLRDDPVKEGNKRGRITYAMAGPNTRTSQVFINFRDNSNLDSQGFAAFGEVTDGMDIVDKLYSGYGDMQEMGGHGPSPGKIETEGNAYLDKNFSQLDKIKTAKILP